MPVNHPNQAAGSHSYVFGPFPVEPHTSAYYAAQSGGGGAAATPDPAPSGRTPARPMVEDVLYFREKTGYLNQPLDTDASDYTYGTDHAILEAAYRTSRPATNRAQVSGDGVFTEDLDWTSIDLIGDSLAQDADLTLDSTTRAHRRGQTLLRAAEIGAAGGYIVVPLNCAQELYDVVTITDLRAPLSGAKRRVVGLDWLYHARKGQYALRISLGGL